jgi:hypothetical protein
METKRSSIPLSPSSANFRQVGIDLSLLALVAGLIFVYLFGLQIARGVFLSTLTSRRENVAAVSSPEHQVTALVVSDSCGITSGCTVPVEFKTDDPHVEEIWRGTAAENGFKGSGYPRLINGK